MLVAPAITVTAAPRRLAASARANPMRPDERLEMKRTGSIASRVAPVVIRIRSSLRSLASFDS
jgi:hypothetical protein